MFSNNCHAESLRAHSKHIFPPEEKSRINKGNNEWMEISVWEGQIHKLIKANQKSKGLED